LQNASGTSASLTLEAIFTAVLAWRLYRENMNGRAWTAMTLLPAGGVVLASWLFGAFPGPSAPRCRPRSVYFNQQTGQSRTKAWIPRRDADMPQLT